MAAQKQPMKLAAMEGLYEGHKGEGLIIFAVPNYAKKSYKDSVNPFLYKLEIPKALAYLGYHDLDAFVPGIKDIIEGGYVNEKGEKALSFAEKQAKGKVAREALLAYQTAVKDKNNADIKKYRALVKENYRYFGYSYFNSPEETIPRIPEIYWSFHIMVYIGGYLILFFLIATFLSFKDKLDGKKWLFRVAFLTVPLTYICSEAGWMVTELGRQPWAIQDILPLKAAVSALSSYAVMTTFFIFLILFTALLIAEIRIMLNQIKKGPEAE
jgi:cytochrome d ubiquinol oxidase subunit I